METAKPETSMPWAEGVRSIAGGKSIAVAGAALIMVFALLAGPLLFFAHHSLDGTLSGLVGFLSAHRLSGLARVLALSPPTWGSAIGLIAFGGFQALLLLVVPGRAYEGPLTPGSVRYSYKDNGLAAFAITMASFLVANLLTRGVPALAIYDSFGSLISTSTLLSLALTISLVIHGLYLPRSADVGSSGSFVFDLFWGVELNPRFGLLDVKLWTNARCGMMGWAVVCLSFAITQAVRLGPTDAMMVSAALQLVYIAKFFWWESGYVTSIDIAADRAGFMICWGCLVFVPAVYSSVSLFLVTSTHELGWPRALFLSACGLACIFVNYDCDRQRQYFAKRRLTGGAIRIWGRPARVVESVACDAETGAPAKPAVMLLASGWWGVARHFHYTPEILASVCWAAPNLSTSALPYTYCIFLCVLLVDRASRVEARCCAKYGKTYEAYKSLVPWKMIPGIW